MSGVNTQPVFGRTPKYAHVSISTANTNRDGTGTLGNVITGGTDGTRIDKIIVKATGTTTAGMVRLFVHDGSNTYLWDEVVVSAITPAASTATFEAEITRSDGQPVLILPASTWILKAGTHNAESFVIAAEGWEF